MTPHRFVLLLALAAFAGTPSARAAAPLGKGLVNLLAPLKNLKPAPPKPTSRTDRTVEGWTIRVDDRLLQGPDAELGARALRFLEHKLGDITVVVPADKVKRLQAVPIVLDLTHGNLGPMQYHPSAGWLKANGYAPDLAKCVHLPRAADVATKRNVNEQPWVILHELAHAYHDQVLGFDEPRVKEAYEKYKKSGRGDKTLLFDGRRVKHYALTTPMEFFAEMTEAYFGANDFFPFNRGELKEAEPEIFELLSNIWDAPAAKPPAPKPRNVVVLLADDWRHDTLGCAGHPVLKTPHLDALAAGGFRFTRACVTTSICGVSRASLLTGQWMSRHGNEAFAMFQTPWAETFPGVLRTNGYWVGHVGKWHNGAFPKDRYDFGRSYAGTHWVKRGTDEPAHVTKLNEADALEFLRTRPKDRPFCLTVAFFAAHAEDGNPKQYLPQPESAALYADVAIPVPATATDAALKRLTPFLQLPANEGRKRFGWRFDTPEKYQEMMKNYYRLCTEVDAACGRVLAELKAQGVFDDTLVVFTGDNGYFHGERGLADKWYPYEESIRVPLIVSDPRLPAGMRGKTNGDFVLNVDIAPTILGAANVAAPPRMQGRDFAPLYRGAKPDPAWRDEFFYEHAVIGSKDRIPASQALVRHGEKYIHWPDFGHDEFFDLAADPAEQHNLAADPAHRDRLAAAKRRLAELKAAAK